MPLAGAPAGLIPWHPAKAQLASLLASAAPRGLQAHEPTNSLPEPFRGPAGAAEAPPDERCYGDQLDDVPVMAGLQEPLRHLTQAENSVHS